MSTDQAGAEPAPEPNPAALGLTEELAHYRATLQALIAECSTLKTELAQIKENWEHVAALGAKADQEMASIEVAREEMTTLKGDVASIRESSRIASDTIAALLTASQQNATNVEQAKIKFEADSAAVVASIPTAQSNVQAIQQHLAVASSRAEEASAAVRDLQSKIPQIENVGRIVGTHEGDLASLRKRFEELNARIEALLPGATSAGLAVAFSQQRSRFKRPAVVWACFFIASLVGLFVVAGIGADTLLTAGEALSSWGAIGAYLVRRLPFWAPLVWLALYSGRQHMIAQRLEEDYAHKEAISRAFEGYKREMTGVLVSGDSPSPLATLSNNVLAALALQPGRIYEGKHHDITPTTPLIELIREAKGLVDQAKGGKQSIGQAIGSAVDSAIGQTTP